LAQAFERKHKGLVKFEKTVPKEKDEKEKDRDI
jgi:hypothetical protein